MNKQKLVLAVLIISSFLFQIGCVPVENTKTAAQKTTDNSNANLPTEKPSRDTSQELASLTIELEKVKEDNAYLQEKLQQSEDEKRELELRLKEWEGLMPHQGIGEFWVEGEVLAIDEENRIITIEQHFDDNSIKVDPKIYLLPQAFIQERLIDLSGPAKVLDVKNRIGSLKESIQVGDTVSFIYRQVDKKAKFIRVDNIQKRE